MGSGLRWTHYFVCATGSGTSFLFTTNMHRYSEIQSFSPSSLKLIMFKSWSSSIHKTDLMNSLLLQHKSILQRKLPESIKLSIAKEIENNLFSKVISELWPHCRIIYFVLSPLTPQPLLIPLPDSKLPFWGSCWILISANHDIKFNTLSLSLSLTLSLSHTHTKLALYIILHRFLSFLEWKHLEKFEHFLRQRWVSEPKSNENCRVECWSAAMMWTRFVLRLSAGFAKWDQVLQPRQHYCRQSWSSNRFDGYHLWPSGRRAAHGLRRGWRGAPHSGREDPAVCLFTRVCSPFPLALSCTLPLEISLMKVQWLHRGECHCWGPAMGWDVWCWGWFRGKDSLLHWNDSHWSHKGS